MKRLQVIDSGKLGERFLSKCRVCSGLRSRRGFTMAELLVVVAIIAVLVAIAISVFNSQLEKSREATDLANVRSAYAEVMNAAITEDTSSSLYNGDSYAKLVSLNQKVQGWSTGRGPQLETLSCRSTRDFSTQALIAPPVEMTARGGAGARRSK